jgi:molecular chaperone GrpE
MTDEEKDQEIILENANEDNQKDPNSKPLENDLENDIESHLKRKTPHKKNKMIHEFEQEIEKLKLEKEEFKDKYLRTLAEMDNFRKRMKKEKEEFQKFVLSDFLIDLLQVFDNFERALKSVQANDNKDSIVSGVEIIYKQLIELLKKNNVSLIEAINSDFDPNIHQALSKEEKADIKVPTVIEVYQKGFLYNDRLLRPALVKVAVPIETEDTLIEKE